MRALQVGGELVALADELSHTVGQSRSTLLDIGPERVAPERVFADGSLERGQPALEAGASARQLRGNGDETYGGLGVENVLDDAGWAAGCEVPVVFLGENAVKPGEGGASLATEGALGLGALLAGESSGGGALGLVVDQEEGDEEGVDDLAVEAESLLLVGSAGESVAGAETRSLHAAFLAAQLLTHRGESLITLQLDLVVVGDMEWRGHCVVCEVLISEIIEPCRERSRAQSI